MIKMAQNKRAAYQNKFKGTSVRLSPSPNRSPLDRSYVAGSEDGNVDEKLMSLVESQSRFGYDEHGTRRRSPFTSADKFEALLSQRDPSPDL